MAFLLALLLLIIIRCLILKSGKYVKQPSGRIDNRARMKERPARDIAVAIREYAPGAEVVIDGLVYKSAGILLK